MVRKVKRLLIPVVYPFFKVYWFIGRPETSGVKCLVWNDKKILLVRMSYGHKLWTIPGGGIKRNESSEDAAKREISEEVGITMSDIKKIGEYETVKEYKNDTVYCFTGVALNPQISVDEAEIEEADWFDLEKLPEQRTKQVDTIVGMNK